MSAEQKAHLFLPEDTVAVLKAPKGIAGDFSGAWKIGRLAPLGGAYIARPEAPFQETFISVRNLALNGRERLPVDYKRL